MGGRVPSGLLGPVQDGSGTELFFKDWFKGFEPGRGSRRKADGARASPRPEETSSLNPKNGPEAELSAGAAGPRGQRRRARLPGQRTPTYSPWGSLE